MDIETYRQLYKTACQAFYHHQLQDAVLAINQLLKLSPMDPDARLLRANIHKSMQDFSTALRDYQLVLIFSFDENINAIARQGIEECCRYYREHWIPLPEASSLHTLVSLPQDVPRPRNRIHLTVGQLVDLYNNVPQILAPIALPIHLTDQTYRNPQDGVWLEEHPKGKYWIIFTTTEQGTHRDYFVPNGSIALKIQGLRNRSILFEFPPSALECEDPNLFLKEPGILQIHPDGKSWKLKKPAILDLQDLRYVGSDKEHKMRLLEDRLDKCEKAIKNLIKGDDI
jgi:hypothetical protein